MKELQDLLTGEKVVNLGKSQVVKGITNNSSKVEKDYAFFAIKGNSTDGHHFIEDAITKGASTVLFKIHQSLIH